jgi:pyoverdine/dityrosine biosynthesis protein Dit1
MFDTEVVRHQLSDIKQITDGMHQHLATELRVLIYELICCDKDGVNILNHKYSFFLNKYVEAFGLLMARGYGLDDDD